MHSYLYNSFPPSQVNFCRPSVPTCYIHVLYSWQSYLSIKCIQYFSIFYQGINRLALFIIKGFRTIVFIFIVISTTFRPICPPAFFRCLLNSGTFTELRTTSFIESTGIVCSDSVSHNRVTPPEMNWDFYC